jgi:hypothetical protein
MVYIVVFTTMEWRRWPRPLVSGACSTVGGRVLPGVRRFKRAARTAPSWRLVASRPVWSNRPRVPRPRAALRKRQQRASGRAHRQSPPLHSRGRGTAGEPPRSVLADGRAARAPPEAKIASAGVVSAAVNRRLRSPFARGDGGFAVAQGVQRRDPPLRPPGTWRDHGCTNQPSGPNQMLQRLRRW